MPPATVARKATQALRRLRLEGDAFRARDAAKVIRGGEQVVEEFGGWKVAAASWT